MSNLTGDQEYARKANAIFRYLRNTFPNQGLLPNDMPHSGESAPTALGDHTLGGRADSYYEYLLKMWVLGGCQSEEWRAAWEAAVDDMLAYAMFESSNRRMAYTFKPSKETAHKMHVDKAQEHLACFMPGNIALGCMVGAVTGAKRDAYALAAHKLTIGCRNMYSHMATGLSVEEVLVQQMTWPIFTYATHNILRPEVIESIFYMWRLTGNQKYRDWGWEMFEAFERYTRVLGGYTGIDMRQDSVDVTHRDSMESFFVAETLKYLLLLFSDGDVLPLNEWVFNTEAHPFKAAPGCGLDTYHATARKLGL